MKTTSLAALFGSMFAALCALGGTVTWTGGSLGNAYQWVAGAWDTGELPGADDTAVFVDIERSDHYLIVRFCKILHKITKSCTIAKFSKNTMCIKN